MLPPTFLAARRWSQGVFSLRVASLRPSRALSLRLSSVQSLDFGSSFSEVASSLVLRSLLFPGPCVALMSSLASHFRSPAHMRLRAHVSISKSAVFAAEPTLRFNNPSETQFTFRLLLPQPYRGDFQSAYICGNGLFHCRSVRAHLTTSAIIQDHGLMECPASEEFPLLCNSPTHNLSS